MFQKRFFVPGLAHASYLFGSNGEAAVVDPKRDVDDYIETAKAAGLKIVAILNTHPHADFASGFMELSSRTGAKIYTSHLAPVKYQRVVAREGDTLQIGDLKVHIWETPGHSPDSLSFVVHANGQPDAIYTGDLLFVGDVGRPDLRDADEDPKLLASKLYDSLFKKVFTLPDEVKIYPAHGAGSLCGRAISSNPSSTVGQEKGFNWAAKLKDRNEFVSRMTSNLPERPPYFQFDVELNLHGAIPLGKLPPVKRLSESDAQQLLNLKGVVIDTRAVHDFESGHLPGSINIGLSSPMFSTWVGFMVKGNASIGVVVDSEEDAEKARLELARIGFDNLAGFLVASELKETLQMERVNVCDLKESLRSGTLPTILDVRTNAEWDSGHIDGAVHIPLHELPKRLAEIPRKEKIAVICGSGYRSSIGASLLEAAGFSQLQNVTGGMITYTETKCGEFEPADLVFSGRSECKVRS